MNRVRIALLGCVALLGAHATVATGAVLGDVTSRVTAGARTVFRCGVPAVVIEWVDPRVCRISVHPDGVVAADSSLAVLPVPGATVPSTVEVSGDTVILRSEALTVRCAQHPFRVRLTDPAGRPLLDEPAAGGFAWNGTTRTFRFGIGDDHLYGLGERAAPFDRRGQSFGTYNQALYGYGSEAPTMNLNIPFMISNRGWGLLFDNAWPGSFDLGSTTPGVIVGSAEAGPLRLYVIQGPDPRDVLERYAWLTGRAPMPPRWAFGYLQSKFGYQNRAEVEALVQHFRAAGIPLDAVILDLYWYGQPGDMGRFQWNAGSWPNAGEMVQNLLSTGVRTVLIEQPYLITSQPHYAEAAAQGFVGTTAGGAPYPFGMWAGTAGLIDFTRPAAADWWWNLHRPLLNQGVAGWWCDLGEPESHPDNLLHATGPARAVHNTYNLSWMQALYDRQRADRPGQRVFLLTRSGFAGQQRTGAVSWSGDVQKSFPALAAQVPMLLGMSLSGVGWHNSDIGGFAFGPTTPELYVRWMQFGAFCPLTRAHGSGQDTEPFAFGAPAQAICRRYLQLRQRLIPYAYTLAREFSRRGLPMARPLVLEYPDDLVSQTVSDEYLWGGAFLVAPITRESAATRAVYLPAGRWTNYWTNQKADGGRWVQEPAPLERMPLFVRDGSIVPMQNPMPSATSWRTDTLTLDVFPADTATFELYEDDGATYAYETGASALTRLSLGTGDGWMRLHIGRSEGDYAGKPATRLWVAQVRHVIDAPTSVAIGGVPLDARADSAAFELYPGGWWWDAASSRLLVKLILPADRTADVAVTGAHVVDAPAPPPARRVLALSADPNPVTDAVALRFSIAGEPSAVALEVFDVRGRRVADLSREVRASTGSGVTRLPTRRLPAGVYFARLRVGHDEVRARWVVLP